MKMVICKIDVKPIGSSCIGLSIHLVKTDGILLQTYRESLKSNHSAYVAWHIAESLGYILFFRNVILK